MQKTDSNVHRWSCIIAGIQGGFHMIVSIMSAMLIIYLLTGVEIDEDDYRKVRLNPRLLILPYFCGFQILLSFQCNVLCKLILGRKAMSKVISQLRIVTILKIVLISLASLLVWNPNAYEVYFPRVAVYPYFIVDSGLYFMIIALINARITLNKGMKKVPVAVPEDKKAVAIDIETVKPEEEKGKIETDENDNEGKALGFTV